MRTLSEGNKVYALTIALSFAVIFSITFYGIHHQYHLELKDTIKENKMMANLLSSLIYEHQKAAAGILGSYAQRSSFIDAVTKKDLNGAIPHLRSLSENHTEIDAPFITDRYGALWANYPVDSKGFGRNLAHSDWYKGVNRNWKPYISSVYRLIVLEKGYAVALSVPVFDRSGKVIGILSAAQRTAFFSAFIKANIKDTEKSIAVLDQEGNIIFSNDLPYKDKITKYPLSKVTEKAVAGVAADMEIENAKEKGGASYVSVVPIKGLGWSVIVGHGKDTILSSMNRHFIFTAFAGFLAFVLLAVSLLYLRKHHKRRETKELLRSEKKYKTLFDEIMDGICLADAETGIIVDCNRALEALVCRGRAELVGQPQTILHPSKVEKEKFSPTFIEHLADKQGQIIETQVVTRTGDIREVEIKAKSVIINNTKILHGLFHDITERKRTAEALEKSEERFRNLFNNAIEGVYRSTPEGRLVSANPSFARILGYESPEEAIKVVTDVASQIYADPDDRKKVIGIFKAAGYIKDFECRMRRKDGSTFWACFNGRLSKNPDEAPCFEGFLIDITERKQAEEELRKINADLEQRVLDRTARLGAVNRELEAFAYSVSHDLRTPLRSIDGFSLALLEDCRDKLDDTGRSYLDRVRNATQYMGRLIDDMLKLSRVARSEFHREPVDLSSMVRAITGNLQNEDPGRPVGVIIEEGIFAKGDLSLLRIALENLVGNAWKFTGKEAQPRVEFGTVVREGKTACFIRDNGAGFDMAYVNKLFGAFQRLHTSFEFPGTGIGLAIVQRIMNRHGGRVWAEAEVGKGATFYFTLPG